MSDPNPPPAALPRMINWLWVTIALAIVAQLAMRADAGSLIAVTVYKAHLLSLGGWGGYWLDRALFPYARPHTYVDGEALDINDLAAHTPPPGAEDDTLSAVAGAVLAGGAAYDYPLTMLRRAIVVAACLVCVGLGA